MTWIVTITWYDGGHPEVNEFTSYAEAYECYAEWKEAIDSGVIDGKVTMRREFARAKILSA